MAIDPAAAMAPDLGPKVAIAPGGSDTSCTFVFLREDHTLGNTLRYILNQDASVEFAGYGLLRRISRCCTPPSSPLQLQRTPSLASRHAHSCSNASEVWTHVLRRHAERPQANWHSVRHHVRSPLHFLFVALACSLLSDPKSSTTLSLKVHDVVVTEEL